MASKTSNIQTFSTIDKLRLEIVELQKKLTASKDEASKLRDRVRLLEEENAKLKNA